MSRLKFPEDMFHLRPGEVPMYGDFPELKIAVEYFRSLMKPGEWVARREAVAKRFYQSLIGELDDPSGKGKYFDDRDLFGWYLFLAEAFTDHPQNYEVFFGCRVIPIFAAIGRNLDMFMSIEGFEDRSKRLTDTAKSQPNGPLFEILVAGAYAGAGGKVAFRLETPGQARSYDIDAEIDGKHWAVECKRMEAGEYAENERQRMRELWEAPSILLARAKKNTILDVDFKLELGEVSDQYLEEKAKKFVRRVQTSLYWNDRISSGTISDLDIGPIQQALAKNHLLHPSPHFTKLLTGSFERYDSMSSVFSLKYAVNPHFIDELGLAVVARWRSSSDDAVEKKARDILKRLSEANAQLPADVAGVAHIGFDALEGGEIERRRYEKILETARKFERGSSQLEFVYCHYFAPDPAPETVWAIDETVQWIGTSPTGRPLVDGRVFPSDKPGRAGVFWDQ